MPEIITAIEEITNYKPERDNYYYSEDGFKITTTEQEILLLIRNGQSCCEDWGYLMSEDDLTKFVGIELLGIEITDTNRTNRSIKYDYDDGPYDPEGVTLDQGDVMFVDIKTSRGTLQFVAYNGHNGYYGHTAKIISKQLTHEVML